MGSDGTLKRKRKRKVRTEVLSAPGYGKEEKSLERSKGGNETQALDMGVSSSTSQERAVESQEDLHDTCEVGGFGHSLRSEPESSQDSKRDFASFYLRKITEELADELDKIRSANDFSEASLPILVYALQQGQSIFSEEEKRRVMGET